MYLKNWKLIVDKGDMPGNYLSVQITLKCPFCRKTTQVETEGYLISKYDLKGTIDRQVTQLSEATWPCPNCGIVSVLPEKDAKTFMQKLQAKITKKWLEKHE
jgi:endogenous inhibitor of DNA gyrase (YacG/DUF329 family)